MINLEAYFINESAGASILAIFRERTISEYWLKSVLSVVSNGGFGRHEGINTVFIG